MNCITVINSGLLDNRSSILERRDIFIIYPGNRIERTYIYKYNNKQFPLKVIFEYNKIYFCIRDIFKILGITREPFEAAKMSTEETYLMKFANKKQRFMGYMTLIFFACSKYIKVTDEAAMNFLDCVQSGISLEPFTYNELSNRIKPLNKKTLNIGSYFN